MTVFANRNGGPPPPPPDRWRGARRAAVELTAEAIEQIAQRVAELLRSSTSHPQGVTALLDAAELASVLGVSRGWVYEHATELGAITLGDGPKARLRFDPALAARAMDAHRRMGRGPVEPSPPRTAPRRRRPRQDVELLPVYEPKARGLCSRVRSRRWRRH